jgi:peptide/nickel transport system substrate-binding protein
MMRLSMLDGGDADAAELSRAGLRDAADMPGVKVYDGLPSWAVGQVIAFNFDSRNQAALRSGRLDGKGVPPGFFADRDVRLGFAYAFNYDVFFKRALRGQGRRAAGPLPFYIYNWKNPEVPFSYDPARAAERFKKAWGGRLWKKGFHTVIGYPAASPEAHAVAEILAHELKDINPAFLLEPLPQRFAAHQKGAQEDLPVMVQTYVADYPDLDTFAFNLLHSAGSLPRAQKYSSRKMDALVEKARSAPEAEREAIYRQIQELYVKDLPQVELYYPKAYQAVRADVSGVGGEGWQGRFSLHNALDFYRIKKS